METKQTEQMDQKTANRYLVPFVVATALVLSGTANAVEGAALDPAIITSAVNGVGMPALIGGAVAAMLGIAVLIWGGKKVIGFFSK